MYNLLIHWITCISVVTMYRKGERIACLFHCYYIRYVLNTQMTASAQMRTGRYPFVKVKFCALCVCCAVGSECWGFRPLVISHINTSIATFGDLFGRIRMRKPWLSSQLSQTVLLLHWSLSAQRNYTSFMTRGIQLAFMIYVMGLFCSHSVYFIPPKGFVFN